ncbi:hypothetical protein RSOL_430110 [Rhizoctonia solani AG-3 Rhs1AP]|uniref:G2/mitotic-specific cyclin cdc13 n=2 Tax=Rhizoctonia solani AG-3 TaxID=1086053 RepID=A0A074RR44_9AGAM|nr:hypothetical protein RSOL_430110 [Rhizoctonia solani AG-3 Rhs1AP]KEP49334.1 hypothetical protein V565_102710 [Rhizoctonia solani 123E]
MSSSSLGHQATPALTMEELNRIICEAINERQSDFTSTTKLHLFDQTMLLEIVFATHPLLASLDKDACITLLDNNESLHSILKNAFAARSFKELVEHPSIRALSLTDDKKQSASQLPSSDSNGSFVSTFETDYRGNSAQNFIDVTNHYARESASAANVKLYNKAISVIQSSGMGKSRMADEIGDTIFTIPANLREKLEGGLKAYPPADEDLREYLEDNLGKGDNQIQAKYAAFIMAVCDTTKAMVESLFKGRGLKGDKLAKVWAGHLKHGQSDDKVGINRREFYSSVITLAKKVLSNASVDRSTFPTKDEVDDILSELLASAQQMLECIAPNHSGINTACYFYFDEAHNLTTPPKFIEGVRSWSLYHNLGKVLAKLSNLPIFFIFLSTNSHLQRFAPVARDYPSYRASDGSFLIPPFTELPFNIFVPEMYKTLKISKKARSLANACTTEVMSCMGRALWFTHYQRWNTQQRQSIESRKAQKVDDIITFANEKLTLQGGTKDHVAESELAALSIRVGITFDSRTPASREAEARQVESHMRIVYAIPEHREYMRTGCSSEPILAEAASRFLNRTKDKVGIAISAPRVLAENIQKGFLAKGERGELCGRLLVTIAHDLAIDECPVVANPLLKDPQPRYHQPVPVLAFLRALFASCYHDIVLDATSMTGKNGNLKLKTAFKNAFVCFSHFTLAKDSEMLEAKHLQTALFRGMAMQAKDNQYSIDAVIPIHMGSITNPIAVETTSAINLQFKNRKVPQSCSVDRRITVPNLKQPVISIIFEFGAKSSKSSVAPSQVTLHDTDSALNPDHNHYVFVAHGCTSQTYEAIPEEVENCYKAILAVDSLKDDFPRADIPESWALVQELRPSYGGADARDEWGNSKAIKSPGSSTLDTKGAIPSSSGVKATGNQPRLTRSHGVKQGLEKLASSQSSILGSSKSHKGSRFKLEGETPTPTRRSSRLKSSSNNALPGASTKTGQQLRTRSPPASATHNEPRSEMKEYELEDEESDLKGKATKTSRGNRRKSRGSIGEGLPTKKTKI